MFGMAHVLFYAMIYRIVTQQEGTPVDPQCTFLESVEWRKEAGATW